MRAKRSLRIYKQRWNSKIPHDLIECDSIFQADYIGVNVPIAKRWNLSKKFPMCIEDIPTDSMILPIFHLIRDLGYRQFTDPNRSLYGTFDLPRKTVILNIDGEQYHIANTLKMVELVRSGCDVIGIAQMVHPNWDQYSDIIDVPIRYCAPIRNQRDYRVFKTEQMPNGFYDPTKPYISVKKVIDPVLGSFITEALRS